MCFSMAWLRDVAIWMIVIAAVIGILRLIFPWILSKLGAEIGDGANIVTGALKIAFWAIVAIFVVIICFQIISCLLGYGGGFPSLTHR